MRVGVGVRFGFQVEVGFGVRCLVFSWGWVLVGVELVRVWAGIWLRLD